MDRDVECPVCGTAARRWFTHPEGEIYRCSACTHAFTDVGSLESLEQYDDDYRSAHQNWFEHPNHALFRWIDRTAPATASSFLDVGCGNGDLLRSLRAARPGARLVGIDLHPETDIPGVEMRRGDVLTDPVEGSFDVVTSLAAIEHVPDVRAFTAKLANLCAPGGMVMVMTLNGDSILYSMARAGGRLGIGIASDRLYSRHHLHHFTRRSLRTLMESTGLEVEKVHHSNAPMGAIDLPPTNGLLDPILRAGVAVTFGLGKLSRRCYLQTIAGRRSS